MLQETADYYAELLEATRRKVRTTDDAFFAQQAKILQVRRARAQMFIYIATAHMKCVCHLISAVALYFDMGGAPPRNHKAASRPPGFPAKKTFKLPDSVLPEIRHTDAKATRILRSRT